MKRMERQAKKTDKSIENLGERLDNVGSDKQLKQMDSVDRQIKSIDRDARTFSGGSGGGGRLRSTLQGAGDDSDRLDSKLIKVGLSLASVGKIFAAMKMPMMVAGVVTLVQGISALGGGLIALLPKLMDVAGAAGAIPVVFTGIGIAALSAKLALSGLGPALKGTKGAMAALTPRAREFVRVMRELKPLGRSLRNSAQAGLFPGLTNALGSLQGGAGTARRLLKRGGETLGGVAERAAGQFTQKGFLRDFEGVGNQGLTVLDRMGSGLINVVQVLRQVAVAAKPFTDWLSKTVVGWTEFWKQSAIAGRRTGELSAYFDRTRAALETFGSILSNLWGTFKGLGHAARPLGNELWRSADKATARWDAFANSLSGQNQLREYFEGLKENISAIFEFTGELSKAFVQLGGSGGFVDTAKSLTSAIKPLEHLFETIGAHYGPALARTLEQLVRLFDNLGGGSFVFLNMLEAVNLLLEGINSLLEKIPLLSNLIVGVLGVVALNSLGARLRGIAADWGLIATNAGRAAVAQNRAGTPMVGGPRPFSSGSMAGTSRGLVVGGMGLPKTLGGRGIGYSTTYQQARSLGYSRSLSTVAQGGALGIGAVRGLAGGIGAAARFLGPAAAIMGGLGFVTRRGGFRERLSAGLSQGSFGLLPEIPTHSTVSQQGLENAQQSVQGLLGEIPNNRRGLRAAQFLVKKKLHEQRANLSDGGSAADAATSVVPYYQRVSEQLGRQIRGRSKMAGATAAEDFSKAWSVRLEQESRRKAGGAMLAPLLDKMGHLGQDGARILAQANLRMYRQIAKDNPKLEGLYKDAQEAVEAKFSMMGQSVEIVNGRILTGSKTEWKNISEVISSQAFKALEETSTAFKGMEREAIGSLMAMGFTRSSAKSILSGMEKGGRSARTARANASAGPVLGGETAFTPPDKPNQGQGGIHRARGGRVAGFGNQDRYAVGGNSIGAAGELLINKHTERDANSMLGMFGTSLGGMVAGEGRPHSELSYAARGARMGITSAGQWASGMGLNVSGGPGFGGIPSSGHVSDSLHYSGLAYDVSGAPNAMYRFRRAAEQRYLGHGLNELFYDPYSYYIDSGSKVPGSIGGHSDHVHIGFFPGGPNGASAVRGLMGGAGGFKAVKAPRSRLGGAPGALSNAAMSGYAAGINKQLAGKAGMQGFAARGPGAFGGMGGVLGFGQLVALARRAGMANPTLMAHIAEAESGGRTGVINSIGATGLWQIYNHPDLVAKYGPMTNAWNNAQGAAELLKTQGLGAWAASQGTWGQYAARGGRIQQPAFAGWFGNGGTVTASSPTLLGIGDGPGTEVAKVVPKGKGRAGGGIGGISIGQMTIQNHRPGDIKKQVKKEVGEAFSELADELDLTPDTDDAEVLG